MNRLHDEAIADSTGHQIQQVLVGNGGAPFSHFFGPYGDKRVGGAEHLENVYGYLVVTVDGASVSAKLMVLDTQSGPWKTADAF
jgi:hypothetical protein